MCYKDGPELPPLNFTTTCVGSARYVIFYNERLDKVTYPEGYEITIVHTELCEIHVRGCEKLGFYGEDCALPCPIQCRDNICHFLNGSCLSCKSGFLGPFCTDKCFKSYGENCRYPCSTSCINQNCDKLNGVCLAGCANNTYGEKCDTDSGTNEKKTSTWLAAGLSIPICLILSAGVSIYLWRFYAKKTRLPCFVRKHMNPDPYVHTNVALEIQSHYQELNVADGIDVKQYQNTTLNV